jgi:hypothetical protein
MFRLYWVIIKPSKNRSNVSKFILHSGIPEFIKIYSAFWDPRMHYQFWYIESVFWKTWWGSMESKHVAIRTFCVTNFCVCLKCMPCKIYLYLTLQIMPCCFFYEAPGPSWIMLSHYQRFTITLRYTTVGRTPLDEWSAQGTDLYLITQNAYNRQTDRQTDIHAAGDIRTHNFSKRATTDSRLRSCGYWEQSPSVRIPAFSVPHTCVWTVSWSIPIELPTSCSIHLTL